MVLHGLAATLDRVTCVWRTESIARRRGFPSGRLHLGPSAWPTRKATGLGAGGRRDCPAGRGGAGRGEGAEKKAKSAVRSSCSGILQGLHQLW